MATSQGVHVLERDAASGTLTPNTVVDVREPRALLWDRGRSKLYVLDGCAWRQLAPDEDSRLALADEGALEIVDGDLPSCDVYAAFLDSAGAYLHYGHADGIEVYAIGETGLTAVESAAIEDFEYAVDSGAGAWIYVTNGHALQTFTRNQNAGALTQASTVGLPGRATVIATSQDDYVVALAEDGSAYAYELDGDLFVLRELNTLGPVGNPSWRDAHGECGFIAARLGAAAFDAFCRNSAFSAAIRVADGAAKLHATDYVANWQADRFNNHVPQFKSEALAASPDGRHVYVYSEGDILIFERIGNRPPAEGEDAGSALPSTATWR